MISVGSVQTSGWCFSSMFWLHDSIFSFFWWIYDLNHVSHLSTFCYSHMYGAPQVLRWAHFYSVETKLKWKSFAKANISSVKSCIHSSFDHFFLSKEQTKKVIFLFPSSCAMHSFKWSVSMLNRMQRKCKKNVISNQTRGKKKSQIKLFTLFVGATCKGANWRLSAHLLFRGGLDVAYLHPAAAMWELQMRRRGERASHGWWRCDFIFFFFALMAT